VVVGQHATVVVIGGGIVGVATAMALAPRVRVQLLEAEGQLAAHQTGHNSGVIHSGLYYRPGSLKARTCTAGRRALYEFCERHGVPFERCGKVVVATRKEQILRLEALEQRGRANGLAGLRRLSAGEIAELEPHARGVAGLFVAETGIVDYGAVTRAFADQLRRHGGEIVTGARVTRVFRSPREVVVGTSAGEFRGDFLVGCAGLNSDRLARLAGLDPGVRIVPFRGEYYEVVPERRYLVRNLIYPVPDPAFPFLGVHFTRRVNGTVEAGPNAVLALKREGYRRTSFSLRDTLTTLTYPGFWRLAGRYARTGVGELWRSWSKGAFVAALQELVPEIEAGDLHGYGAGVRAQALGRDGQLLDDFHLVEGERQLHVLNAPSPAATASIAIGRTIAERVLERLGVPPGAGWA
jgi:L-2-hydroxyglutarate oxidase